MKIHLLLTFVMFFSYVLIEAKTGCDSIQTEEFQAAGIAQVRTSGSDSTFEEVTMYEESLTSDECDLYLGNKTVLSDVELRYLNDSTVLTKKDDKPMHVDISEIRKIVFKPAAPFGKGFLIGAGIGFLAGFLPSLFIEPHPGEWGGPGIGLIVGLILVLPSGVIGGVVGILTSSDDTYLFDKGITKAKINRLKYIIKKHPK